MQHTEKSKRLTTGSPIDKPWSERRGGMINSDCTSIIKIITLTGQKKQQQQPGHPNLIRNWEVGVLCWQLIQISHCCFVHFNKYYENTLSLSLWFQLSLPPLLHPKPTACYWRCKASKTPLSAPTGPMKQLLTKLFLFTPISFSTLLKYEQWAKSAQ